MANKLKLVIGILVTIGVLSYIYIDRGDRIDSESTSLRQALSKKLVEVCTVSQNCPKGIVDLIELNPELLDKLSQISKVRYFYDEKDNHWKLAVRLNSDQVAIHDSRSKYREIGELYSLEAARRMGLWD